MRFILPILHTSCRFGNSPEIRKVPRDVPSRDPQHVPRGSSNAVHTESIPYAKHEWVSARGYKSLPCNVCLALAGRDGHMGGLQILQGRPMPGVLVLRTWHRPALWRARALTWRRLPPVWTISCGPSH